MRKHFLIIVIILISFILFSSCGYAPSTLNEPNAQSPQVGAVVESPTAEPHEKDVSVSPDITPRPSEENAARETVFLNFVSDNFEELSDAFFNGISGIGFVDLDLDGGIEMIIFDAGASASMGVQFFDIIEDKVECVSANMQPVKDAFGGDYISDVNVSANYFEDFRLMKDKATGEMFYLVTSGNGAIDFSDRELIRFGSNDSILSLKSLLYKHEEYNEETMDVIGSKYRIGKNSATLLEYTAAYDKIFSGSEDIGLECKGVFVWDNQGYNQDKESVLSMTKAAIELSRNNFPM